MRLVERTTPIMAALAALSTLACCAPFGFLAALGLAGASVWLLQFRLWLLGLAALALAVGFWQLYRARKTFQKTSTNRILTPWDTAWIGTTGGVFTRLIASSPPINTLCVL